MEEPTPCEGCDEIVELQSMRKCHDCGFLLCKQCMGAGLRFMAEAQPLCLECVALRATEDG